MNQNYEAIVVRGARVHNLKNLNVTIPRDKLTVITGPSGSGKSSLVFDTIYAEGQRRYVESLSVYARQFIQQLSKPDAESIEGLSPTISIEQRTTSYNPRSTVGTVTEIYDYLRLLFSRIGRPFCWSCGEPIKSQSAQQITDQILSLPEASRIAILAPIARARKGEYQKDLQKLRSQGFVRVKIDGETIDLSQEITLDKNKKHDIDVYIDRLILKGSRDSIVSRVGDSVELALKLGGGQMLLQIQESSSALHDPGRPAEIFYSELFACVKCNVNYPSPEPRIFSFNSPLGACPQCDGVGSLQNDGVASPCPGCRGARLRKESLHFKLGINNISELCRMTILDLAEYFNSIKLSDRELMIAERIIKEIKERLRFIKEVGADYLSLERSAQSLSGGELQRIRLATQIGSSLVGVTYILDEPSIGLHPRDHARLLKALNFLRDLGNTILVVEHDRETIEGADWVVDLGPGAGTAGGELIVSGTPTQVCETKHSLTGKYLRGDLKIPLPSFRRPWTTDRTLRLEGVGQNNLKNISVDFPLSTFICVTGVSGSGKSSLVLDTLYPLLQKHLYGVSIGEIKLSSFSGLDHIDKVIDIDQKPIGKTPRSNPATYTGLFGFIRDLFSNLPESQIRGYGPGKYSFNVKGGRCETCEGDGMIRVVMHFLPDVFIRCGSCGGARYNREILSIRYKGKNIADVLDMTAHDAYLFFDSIPWLHAKLKTLNDVGLGYLRLGQSATTLSGGEAQRIKLAKELSRRSTGRTMYILDEPSTGLHFDDVNKLVSILQKLVDQGNTVIVIEHNPEIIKVADYIIDLGPEGGLAGGKITAQGTPEEICSIPESHTGRYLSPYLNSPKLAPSNKRA